MTDLLNTLFHFKEQYNTSSSQKATLLWLLFTADTDFPHINWATVCLLLFPYFGPESGDLSVVRSDWPCLQAVINYNRVSLAQTPPSMPPLCDTGHIIILTSNKHASAILGLEEFLFHPIVGISAVKIAAVFCSLWERREDENMGGLSHIIKTVKVFVVWEIRLSNKKIQPNQEQNSC